MEAKKATEMEINGIIMEPYREGWVIKYPYIGKNGKTGAAKTQYKEAFFPRISHCLMYIRDRLAKDCTTTQELIELFKAAERIDEIVLARNGIIETPRRIAA